MENFQATLPKEEVFKKVAQYLGEKGFRIVSSDQNRPWGGFFVLDESQSSTFIQTYFTHLSISDFSGYEKLSPKILIVAPHQRLSWQYHHRRAEIWKVIGGDAGIVVSDTDQETDLKELPNGTVIELRQGERHRLIGLDGYGIVAEIWKHTDPQQPSDEDDIVRVQDDFGR